MNMMNMIKQLVAVSLFVGVSPSAWGQKSLKMEAGGIQIVGRQENEEFNSVRPFNQQLGTKVAIIVRGGRLDCYQHGRFEAQRFP